MWNFGNRTKFSKPRKSFVTTLAEIQEADLRSDLGTCNHYDLQAHHLLVCCETKDRSEEQMSQEKPRKPRLGVPTCDKKWQFSLGQLDSVKKRYVCWFVSRKVVKVLQLGRWNLALLIFWNLQRLGVAKMGHLELGGWSFDLKQSNSSDFMIAWRSCNVLWPSSTVK